MTTLEQPTTAGLDEEAPPSTLMTRLRAKQRAAANAKTVDFAIPGYGGELVARYRLLDPLTDGKEIGDNVQREFRDDDAAIEFYGFVDSLLRAHEGMYYTDAAGELKLLDEDGDGPMTYADPRLATFLDIDAGDPPTARNAIIAVFGGNKVKLVAHGRRFQYWMADPEGQSRLGEA